MDAIIKTVLYFRFSLCFNYFTLAICRVRKGEGRLKSQGTCEDFFPAQENSQ